MVGVNPSAAGEPGGFRLARDEGGKVHVEQIVGEGGGGRGVCPPMTAPEFLAAVRFVHESLSIKTVMVARQVSQRRKRRL